MRREATSSSRCGTSPRGWRRATGSRSSTSSSGARRAAWCCGSRSIGRARRRRRRRASASTTAPAVSRDLSAVLDVEDVVPTAYTLEVSSPGLDRPLRRADDYRRFAGRRAKIVMREAVDGQTFFKGRLGGVDERATVLHRRRRWPAAPGAVRRHHAGESGSGILRGRAENHVEPIAADDRGAGQRKGHRARRRHQRHRGSGRDRLAQVLQDRREPEDAVQHRDRPGRPLRAEDRRRGGRPIRPPRSAHRRSARDVPAALRRRGRQQHRARRRDGVPEADRSARPHRRADRQAGDLPEGARGRAREHLRRVQPAHRRGRQRHGQAVRERRHHPRNRPHRGGAAAQGAVARRELHAAATASGPSSRA